MTGLFTSTARLAVRLNATEPEYQAAFIVAELAKPLLREARFCGDVPAGPWLFLARSGEGAPPANAALEGKLWTAIAEIDPETGRDPVRLRPGSSQLHATDAEALERITAATGLAGMAICLDRKHDRNAALIFALTGLLEPRHPDHSALSGNTCEKCGCIRVRRDSGCSLHKAGKGATGPMVWYGPPIASIEPGGHS